VLVRPSFAAFGARLDDDWNGLPSAAEQQQFANHTRRGFTGHEMLDNVGLVHMNGRVYDPALGRFVCADPFIDGETNPQGCNRYAYVQNRPCSLLDQTGFGAPSQGFTLRNWQNKNEPTGEFKVDPRTGIEEWVFRGDRPFFDFEGMYALQGCCVAWGSPGFRVAAVGAAGTATTTKETTEVKRESKSPSHVRQGQGIPAPI
jgi:RHS repeat-associated protein